MHDTGPLAAVRACGSARGPGSIEQAHKPTEWVALDQLAQCEDRSGRAAALEPPSRDAQQLLAWARALPVSHWSVDDRATQALMTEVFRRAAADPTLPRAEALRQGMLALLAQGKGPTAYFAHPFAWAAFFLVGDGGASH